MLNVLILNSYEVLSHTFCRHSGVTGGKQSPITVGAGFQDPSAIGNRPLAELCKLPSHLLLENTFSCKRAHTQSLTFITQ